MTYAVGHDAKVRVADTRMGPTAHCQSCPRETSYYRNTIDIQVDENLPRTRLGDIQLHNIGRYRARLVIDGSLLLFGDLGSSHIEQFKGGKREKKVWYNSVVC